jgi:hypothetical protein
MQNVYKEEFIEFRDASLPVYEAKSREIELAVAE